MKIQRIILSNYIRFALYDISYISIDISSPLQLILGANGSGKSSLLAELTPLPATPSDYKKGGYKEIHISYNDSDYILRSDINKGAKHSFLKQGTELNPGGTATVQKELVEKELGFTTQLHLVLTGKVKFTDMSAQKRKEWLMLLCPCDFDYVNKVFDKVKTASRDAIGAFKHIQEKRDATHAKLTDLQNVEQIESRTQTCMDTLTVLLENKVPVNTSVEEVQQKIKRTLSTIKESSLQALALDVKPYFLKGLDNVECIDKEQFTLSTKRAELASQINAKTEELQHHHDTLNAVVASGSLTIQELEEKRIRLVEQQQQIVLSTAYTLNNIEVSTVLQDCENVYDKLYQWCVETPPEARGTLERSTYPNAVSRRDALLANKTKCIKALEKSQHTVSHAQLATDAHCPKCQFTFKPGIDAVSIEKHTQLIEHYTGQLEAIEKEYNTCIIPIQQYEEYITNMRILKSIMNAYPRMDVLWKAVIEKEFYYSRPLNILQQYQTYKEAVELQGQRQSLQTQIEEIDTLMRRLEQASTDNVSQRIATLEQDIDTRKLSIQKIEKEITYLHTAKNTVARYHLLMVKVKEDTLSVYTLYDELVVVYRQALIAKDTGETQSTLATLQSLLNQKQTLTDILVDLQADYAQLDIDTQAWQLLQETLSPNAGIIAQQLGGFIQSVVLQMNSIISKLWSYNLNVLPCSNENGNLNYLFPLQVEGVENPVKDISLASEGQKEVVNFAFMITVMHYLDLHDYPMYLDETGATFDTAHRERLMSYIKLLIDTGQAGQLFLVNHYASFSGGLANAQTCVLNEQNVVLPTSYNEHVSFAI